jgi:hypothetical protein
MREQNVRDTLIGHEPSRGTSETIGKRGEGVAEPTRTEQEE